MPLFKVEDEDAGKAGTWSAEKEDGHEDEGVADDGGEEVEEEDDEESEEGGREMVVATAATGVFTVVLWRICWVHVAQTAASFFFLSWVAEKRERGRRIWHRGQHRVDGGAASRQAGEGVRAEDSEQKGGGVVAVTDGEGRSASGEAAAEEGSGTSNDDSFVTREMTRSEDAAGSMTEGEDGESADRGDEKSTRGVDGVISEAGVEKADGLEEADDTTAGRGGSVDETARAGAAGESDEVGAVVRELEEERDAVTCRSTVWEWKRELADGSMVIVDGSGTMLRRSCPSGL